jgi:hypothetical protein
LQGEKQPPFPMGKGKMRLVGIKEASERTGLSREQIRLMVLEGKLTGFQPGGYKGKIFVAEDDIARMMQPMVPRYAREAK